MRFNDFSSQKASDVIVALNNKEIRYSKKANFFGLKAKISGLVLYLVGSGLCHCALFVHHLLGLATVLGLGNLALAFAKIMSFENWS